MMIDKKELRKQQKSKRNSMNETEKQNFDSAIFEKVITSDEYIKAKSIFIFVSYQNEVDTHKIIEHSLKCGKIVTVPRVISKEEGMDAVRIESFEDLESGAYGILEPKKSIPSYDKKKIDIIYLPGLAFDNKGGRIGYGAGYYDRFLKEIDSAVIKIGLGYSFQMIDEVPMDKYDIRIDKVILN